MEMVKRAVDMARRQREAEAAATAVGGPAPDRPRPVPAILAPVGEGDVDAAWAALPALDLSARALRRQRIVTADQRDPAHMSYDMLRTRVLQKFRAEGWRALALTSPAPGCGKTLTCANLAFSFARQPSCRTLVLDLDLRRPRLAAVLGVRPAVCVSRMLRGEVPAADALLRAGPTLAFGLAAGPVRHSAELLQDPRTTEALAAMTAAFAPDVILYDLPPLLASDDAAAFLGRVDGALLVAAAGETALEDVEVCAKQLGALTHDLGVILNKSEFMPRRYYGYGY